MQVDKKIQLSTGEKTDLSTKLSTLSTVEKQRERMEKHRQYKTSVLCDFFK